MSQASAYTLCTIPSDQFCTTALAICEQSRLHSSSVTIPEASLSVEFLKNLFAKFKVDSSVDEDGELLIPEAFGPFVRLRINPDRHWVILMAGFDTPSLTAEDRLEFANLLNTNLTMAQFGATDNGIGLAFFMYYRGGLSVDQFMAMAQRFGSLAYAAMRRYTTFQMPSDKEAEEDGQAVTLN